MPLAQGETRSGTHAWAYLISLALGVNPNDGALKRHNRNSRFWLSAACRLRGRQPRFHIQHRLHRPAEAGRSRAG
ncbi:protein of unknown function [Hyphomicrobium sp. 1Nfss2.1]